MRRNFYFILWLCITLMADLLNAQEKTLPVNANVSLVPEEENLNVFQQWIKWNNPGSLLINHLIKQATDLYEIRDREIAKLKTKASG